MPSVDTLRRRADEILNKASKTTDRGRARSLLVKAHEYLKTADETEAQQFSAGAAQGPAEN